MNLSANNVMMATGCSMNGLPAEWFEGNWLLYEWFSHGWKATDCSMDGLPVVGRELVAL